MSELIKSDRYEELYKKYKRLVDRADNPCIRVIHYLDKKHHFRAIVDIDNAIYIEQGVHKFRIGGNI